jgi:hypothetical protein
LRELLIRRPKAMDDDGKITLEPEERALLADVHNAGAREFEVVKEKGKSTARFDAAHTLEKRGLITWVRCAGSAGRDVAMLRVSYRLTPQGAEVARTVGAS